MNKKRIGVLCLVIGIIIVGVIIMNLSNKILENKKTTPMNVGYISGHVFNIKGTALGEVRVSADGKTTVTDEYGSYNLSNISLRNRILVTFQKDNYIPTQKIASVLLNETTYLDAMLIEDSPVQSIDASSGGTITQGRGSIQIPPNSLVDSRGKQYKGMVNVALTAFDPSNENHRITFPGRFYGLIKDPSTGESAEVPFESFGYIYVSLTDQEGKSLQLAKGKNATIEIPIPVNASEQAPPSIDLWYFDNTNGYWVKEGFAVKDGDKYRGEVGHFSWWNCDRTYNPFGVTAVTGVRGSPVHLVSNAVVICDGVDYYGRTEAVSGPDGRAVIQARPNSTVRIWATWKGLHSRVQVVNTGPSGESVDIGTIVIEKHEKNTINITLGENVWVSGDNDTFGTPWPNIVVDSDDNLYIAWVGWLEDYPGVWLAKSTDGGSTFSQEEVASGADTPQVLVDANTIHVVYTKDGFVKYKKSTDDGYTFGPEINVSDRKASSLTVPKVALDSGILYVLWDDDDGNIMIDKSTDGGVSFGKDVKINPNGRYNGSAGDIAVNNGIVFVIWRSYYDNILYFAKSTDGSRSFTNPVCFSEAGSPYSRMAIGAYGNNIYIVWEGYEGILFTQSYNAGDLFEATIKISNGTRPTLCNYNDKLFIAYEDNGNISLIASGNGGATFGEPIIVTNMPPEYGKCHRFPSITVDRNYVYIVWEDGRYGNADVFFCKGRWSLIN